MSMLVFVSFFPPPTTDKHANAARMRGDAALLPHPTPCVAPLIPARTTVASFCYNLLPFLGLAVFLGHTKSLLLGCFYSTSSPLTQPAVGFALKRHTFSVNRRAATPSGKQVPQHPLLFSTWNQVCFPHAGTMQISQHSTCFLCMHRQEFYIYMTSDG